MATHYKVLGVHSQSDPASIRAAYLGLMRRYHPDSPERVHSALGDRDIYRINQAYSVLRDPAKRAEYDSELLRQRMRRASTSRTLPVVIAQRRPGSDGRRYLWLMIPAALLAVAGSQLAGSLRAIDRSGSAGPTSASATARGELVGKPAESNMSGIQEMTDLAGSESLEQARVSSARCFAEARTFAAASAADLCIAFDIAFAYWHEAEFRGTPAEDYFLPQMLEYRHRAALAALPQEEARARIDSIRSAVFTTLVSARSEPAPVANLTDEANDVGEAGQILPDGTSVPEAAPAQ
jgi:curved DNA-binding protein CbpA